MVPWLNFQIKPTVDEKQKKKKKKQSLIKHLIFVFIRPSPSHAGHPTYIFARKQVIVQARQTFTYKNIRTKKK